MGKRVVVVALGLGMSLVAGVVVAQAEPPVPVLPDPELSGVWLATVLFVLGSVLLEYVPGLRTWWKGTEYKRALIAGAGLVLTGALVAGHYVGVFDLALGPFGWPVIQAALNAWLALLGGDWLVWSLLNGAVTLPRKRI